MEEVAVNDGVLKATRDSVNHSNDLAATTSAQQQPERAFSCFGGSIVSCLQ